MNVIRDAFVNYFTFRGRTRRKGFWLFILFTVVASFALSMVDDALFYKEASDGAGNGSGPLAAVFQLLVFVPSISISVRRLHDTGRSGWWLLLPLLPMLVGLGLLIITWENGMNSMLMIGLGIAVFVCYITIFIFFVLPSKPDNRFGIKPYPAITTKADKA